MKMSDILLLKSQTSRKQPMFIPRTDLD